MEDVTKVTEGTLIPAEKVTGTNVYNFSGDKLGKIEDVMIDKASGRSIYAVLSFGGFMGIGDDYYPLPWSTLKYDTEKDGYVVNIEKETLDKAPSYKPRGNFNWNAEYGRKVDSHYNTPTVWM